MDDRLIEATARLWKGFVEKTNADYPARVDAKFGHRSCILDFRTGEVTFTDNA